MIEKFKEFSTVENVEFFVFLLISRRQTRQPFLSSE